MNQLDFFLPIGNFVQLHLEINLIAVYRCISSWSIYPIIFFYQVVTYHYIYHYYTQFYIKQKKNYAFEDPNRVLELIITLKCFGIFLTLCLKGTVPRKRV
jgi:hypothetical protein